MFAAGIAYPRVERVPAEDTPWSNYVLGGVDMGAGNGRRQHPRGREGGREGGWAAAGADVTPPRNGQGPQDTQGTGVSWEWRELTLAGLVQQEGHLSQQQQRLRQRVRLDKFGLD